MNCFFIFLFIGLSITSCSAKNMKSNNSIDIVFTDSVTSKIMNDSICDILMKGKIKSMLVEKDSVDVVYKNIKALNKKEKYLLRFLISDTDMYLVDTPNFGMMMPCLRFEFKKSKVQILYLNVDFGLHKWSISNIENKTLAEFCLNKNDMLRFCHLLYPNNKLITEYFKSMKK